MFFLKMGKRTPSFCTCRNKLYICCNLYQKIENNGKSDYQFV